MNKISYIQYLINRLILTRLEIKCMENGPNLVVVEGKVTAALCRCGGSNNKPYCDGTHAKIGFKAEAKEIKISE
jgi:CDGSH-type Zn-finger protein